MRWFTVDRQPITVRPHPALIWLVLPLLVLLSVPVASTVVRAVPIQGGTARALITLAFFVAFNIVLMGPRRPVAATQIGQRVRALGSVLTVAVVVLLLSLVTVHGLTNMRWSAGVLLFVTLAAMAEEIVYRILLPRRLAAATLELAGFGRVAGTASQIISQTIFAVSHFLPGASRGHSPSAPEFLSLVLAGLLYWQLLRLTGLGVTTGIHAAVNYGSLVTPTAALGGSNGWVGLALACGCIWISARFPHETGRQEATG